MQGRILFFEIDYFIINAFNVKTFHPLRDHVCDYIFCIDIFCDLFMNVCDVLDTYYFLQK